MNSNFLRLCSTHNPWTYELLLEKETSFSSDAVFHTSVSERECTPLLRFYEACIQSNRQLAFSRLMHRIYCSGVVFL